MSRRVATAPLAVGSDGSVFANIAELGTDTPERLLQLALDERGDVFIGVRLTPAEAWRILRHVDDGITEAVARTFGERARRRGRQRVT